MFHFCTVLLLRLADRGIVVIKVVTQKEKVVRIVANSELVRFH
jgi:hypothetical protein